MDKFVNPETIAKMQSDIKKKAGLNTNNTFKGNNNFEKAPTINGEEIATITPNGTNYLMVYGVGTPTENAAELQAAYDEAKNMPRYIGMASDGDDAKTYYIGQSLYDAGLERYIKLKQTVTGTLPDFSADPTKIEVIPTEAEAKSVRTTVIVAPGHYTFGVTKFNVNTIGIDIVSLTGNADVLLDGINITNEYVYIKGINCGDNVFLLNDDLVNLVIDNCYALGDNSFSGDINNSNRLNGVIKNCTGGLNAFCKNGSFKSTAIVENCKLTISTFADIVVEAGGKIINCVNADGSIYNSVNVAVPDGVDAGDAINKRQLDTKAVINNTELLGSTSIQQLAIGIGNINPSGTISNITNGVVTGNGTKFTSEFYAGAKIYFPSVSGGAPQTITSIANDFTLVITDTSASVPSNSSYSGDIERALNVGFVILEFADNAAAVTGGLVNGDMYRTADVLKVVHT